MRVSVGWMQDSIGRVYIDKIDLANLLRSEGFDAAARMVESFTPVKDGRRVRV